MRPRNSSRSGHSGFTLLEVLVSLAIIAIAVTVVLQLFSADLRAISASENYLSAVTKAEAKMREVLDDENLAEKAWSDVTPDGYRMDIYVSDVLKDRTNTLPVRLVEVGLTMRWTTGIKEKVLTLKTMKLINKVTLATTPATAAAPTSAAPRTAGK